MSLKCSIFGHDFGDPDIEREREEQGSEVVITITETETCRRCGEQRVVSENKEVTSLETPSDIVGDDLVEEPSDEPDDDLVEEAEEMGGGAPPEPEEPTAAEDDAVILDEDDEDEPEPEPGRSPGEWPEEDQPEPEEPPAEAAPEDGRQPGEWPDDGRGDPEADWSPDIEPSEEPASVEPTEDAITVPQGEFYCPECGFTTAVESSSLREGDFCPECHRGTLSQRIDEE